VLRLGLAGLLCLSAMGRSWAQLYSWSFSSTAGRFDANGDTIVNFAMERHGTAEAFAPPGIRSRTEYKTWFVVIEVLPTDQVLTTIVDGEEQLLLMPPGTPLGSTPPEGAVWASSYDGYPYYYNEKREDYVTVGHDNVWQFVLLYESGPFLEHTNWLAGARYQAADGWHYGWIGFKWVNNGPGYPLEPDFAAHWFHPRADAPVWAGEALAPRLRVALGDEGVTISWTSYAGGFVLESADEAPGAGWIAVEGVSAVDAEYQAVLPVTGERRFFRLRQE
jgi:hypothetical protein